MTDRAVRENLADVLAEIRAELGPATDEETAWASSVLGLSSSAPRPWSSSSGPIARAV